MKILKSEISSWLLFAFLPALVLGGCEGLYPSDPHSSASSIMDGYWAVSAWSCGSIDLLNKISAAGQTPTMTMLGQKMQFQASYADGCVLTIPGQLSYESGTNIVLAMDNATCSSACSTAECAQILVFNPNATFTYAYQYLNTGAQESKVLSRTLSQSEIGNGLYSDCAAGTTEALTISVIHGCNPTACF